ncbi:hypothetical protein EQM14_01570 [Caproiciproducens sp. NJN-50]|uniref:hypothetical protein n=1 Tax=Caproiciproducens sp. NJN-50 TaxID=2507162 RepID=UPI000FFE3360|nr:hypothetical protein [Caproiciproducens sp. NJN-50]QAT48573.1 hypothetical protein EQM14_01570 [Caproiciproducens sp. NJN-50]
MPDLIQQIRDTYSTDKAAALNMLPELFQQYDEGKIVELPCKVGDKVFVRADTWGNTWNFVTVDYGKLLVGEIIGIVKTRKQTLMKIQVEHHVSWKKERKRYPVGAIGITVFLTESEAKEHLKNVQKGF